MGMSYEELERALVRAGGEIARLRAALAARQDGAPRMDRETIARSLEKSLLSGDSHGCKIYAANHLDNFVIDGHVNLLALADAVLATHEQGANNG